MATLKSNVKFDGDRRRIVEVTINGAEGAEEASVADVSTITGPDEVTGSGYLVLEEAVWNMIGYDSIKLYYHDEGNDEVVINMSGDGSYSNVGYGAGPIDIEASTPSEDDYDILLDYEEDGDENTNSAAIVVLSFRKRLIP